MTEINYMLQGNAVMPALNEPVVREWIVKVADLHGQRVGCLTYVFCDDEYILDHLAGYRAQQCRNAGRRL